MGLLDAKPPDPDNWRNLFPFVEDGPGCGLALCGFVVFVIAVLVVKHFFFF